MGENCLDQTFWETKQQGQVMLSYWSWRKVTWGRHRQAAWESAIPDAANLNFLPFRRFQKFGIAKKYGIWSFDLLVGLISNQGVWIRGCHFLCSLLLLIYKSSVWTTYHLFCFVASVFALESRGKEHYHRVTEICRSSTSSEISDFCSVEVPD